MSTQLTIVSLSPDLASLESSVLRKTALPIDSNSFDAGALRRVIKEMFRVLYQSGGVGLAAPQVGLQLQLVVIDTSRGRDVIPLVLINPRITSYGEELVEDREGCLSIPEYAGLVERSKHVALSYWNQNFEPIETEAEDYLARVIQHEVDHLSGILYIDRIKDPSKLSKVDPDILSQKAYEKLYTNRM